MQTGATISGGAHAALIALAFLSGMDLWANDPPELLVVTEVTLIRADQFDVITSAAPAMPVMDMADMAQPDAAFDAPVAPEADIAPQDSELEETAEPDSADLEPDLTALLLIEQPEVSNVDVMPVIAPQLDESAPAIFQPAQNGNELNAPLTSISAPPLRNAPRIDTTAALRPPE
ncbi:MAG: hypothetical protein JKY31_06235, partial [Rhodobacteraceae bacterium]|nr:hypothetical protein [Paracoccaceae bacterium]